MQIDLSSSAGFSLCQSANIAKMAYKWYNGSDIVFTIDTFKRS